MILSDSDTVLLEYYKQFKPEVESGLERRPLKDYLVLELLRQIANGDRQIESMVADRETGDVFVCFGFTDKSKDAWHNSENGGSTE